MKLQNKVQLITYPDSLGSNLLELHYVLKRYLKNAIGGVHILPFYPSSADRGFAPITYDEVDPVFGSWQDIDAIGGEFDVIIDFMVNHISRKSPYFLDYIKLGDDSEFADMFLSFKKLFPDKDVSDEDLAKVYTRKPRPPYSFIQRPDGSQEKIWSTFDFEQIDLDWQSPKTLEVMRNFLIHLARKRIKVIRMDAFAYTTIKVGTNCFFLEPEVWELLDWLEKYISPFDTEILPEVHEHYSYQLKLAEKGYWTYDFALPMLVLHTLYHHTNKKLLRWLKICPRKQITTLDTHDGIGIVDVAELLSDDEIEATINGLYKKGSNAKKIYSSAVYQNLDVYQINCTYFSALECNVDSYIAARAIQFFCPGIPQVYYVGLLAGKNDIDLVEMTQNGRDINRHNYTLDEIETEFESPVVKRLMKLMTFRSSYPAFNGDFMIEDTKREDQIKLTWRLEHHKTTVSINLKSYKTQIYYYEPATQTIESFIA